MSGEGAHGSSSVRIGVLAAVFAGGLFVVLLHLWFVMVHNRDVWARRSYQNRWAFRSVPSQRGALLDRDGQVLAYDEPSTRVSVYYLRFRLRHVVGAAVHGAMRWATLQRGLEGTVYGYREGVLGPRAAGRDVLAIPVRALQPGVLSKEVRAELATYATTVLAGCSGLSRRQVYSAMRTAAQDGARIGIGDVLDVPRADLQAAFDERLRSLHELDQRLFEQQQRRADRLGIPVEELPGLIDVLEELRRASLAEQRVTWKGDDGKMRQGSLLEDVRRVFASDVAFELAAALRVERNLHPGIEVEPSVTRLQHAQPETALRVLLGNVVGLDRRYTDKDEEFFARHRRRELPEEWLEDLVPEGLVDGGAARSKLQDDARRRYERAMLRQERTGVTGLEAAFDGELMGRLGMRFVEHDSRRREQLLWSNLRVESGEDVQLTIDLDLQIAAENAARAAVAKWRPRHTIVEFEKKCEAALAIVDAHTGDILAYGGAPIVSESARDVPGVVWLANGAIGSVIKPFMLLEQLEAIRHGLPHVPFAELAECPGSFQYGDRTLDCDGRHWAGGRDPVTSLAESCNVFFYQVGLGLGVDGLQRALRRVGLCQPGEGDDPFRICWQPDVRGFGAARPRLNTAAVRARLPLRSIGYGVEASPVHIARAYAALATGALPTLGMRLGEQRPLVQLGDLDESLQTVRQGLRECVLTGTGRRLTRLKELEVHAKTGTAQVNEEGHNNAWFAGFLPWTGQGGMQLAFCAVVYYVPHKTHGGEAAGGMLVEFLQQLERDPRLSRRYLTPVGGR